MHPFKDLKQPYHVPPETIQGLRPYQAQAPGPGTKRRDHNPWTGPGIPYQLYHIPKLIFSPIFMKAF